jgi:subtilisin family serine protease
MRNFFCWVAVLFWAHQGLAQPAKYWLYFSDKATQHYDYRQHLSPKTIQNRLTFGLPLVQYTDIPLTQAYLQDLARHGVVVVCQSKWLNAVTARLTPEQVEQLRGQPYVRAIVPMDGRVRVLSLARDASGYGSALDQIGANEFAKAGLNGEGIDIGVIDAGFLGAKDNAYLEHLFTEKRVLGTRDLLSPHKADFFSGRETSSDDHGNTVLQMITGHADRKTQYGLATKANFYLARTDHGDREFRAEEDYWVASMEWMDSLGVRLINTSLGYANGFDDPKDNYLPTQMDGKTSVISQAAQIAHEQKGILLVVSAGNEGSESDWQVVSAPADAPGVVSVGALSSSGLKAYYSSTGPESLPYLKPNVACAVQVSAGTSFSAPVITGFAACLMQKNPQASSREIFQAIEKSGQLYPYGNNFIGYGAPRAAVALRLVAGDSTSLATGRELVRAREVHTIKLKPNKAAGGLAFHKKNATAVLAQEVLSTGRGKCVVYRKKQAARTTVVLGDRVVEIVWQ